MRHEDFGRDCRPSFHCQKIHGFSREAAMNKSTLPHTCTPQQLVMSQKELELWKRTCNDWKKRERGTLRCVWWIHSHQWWMEWRLQQIQSRPPSQACKVMAHTHHFVHSLLLLGMLKLHQKPRWYNSSKRKTQCKTESELGYLLDISNGDKGEYKTTFYNCSIRFPL